MKNLDLIKKDKKCLFISKKFEFYKLYYNRYIKNIMNRTDNISKTYNNMIISNNTEENDILINDEEPKIIKSKFNKNIENGYNKPVKKLIKNNEEIIQEENLEEEDLEEEFDTDCFQNYIIAETIKPFTKNAEYCKFNWNGIELLEKWELNRKVDKVHATNLAKSMLNDYTKYKEFIFFDFIHIGKKKNDSKYYVLDGQHRLEAYLYFYERNKYPIQQIPSIIWYADDDEHFFELFNKINSRLSIDKLKLMQIKLLDIITGLENKYGKNIWGINRPKINKNLFCDKLKNNDNAHKLSSDEILIKLFTINEKIRVKPRASRVKPNVNISIHNSAESMDLFLGLDKTMSWINEI